MSALTVRATTAKDRQHAEWQDVLRDAYAAGEAAVAAKQVMPMIVGTPRNLAASLMGGDDGGFDPNETMYFVADGVCGFAWVNVKAKGNRAFVNWLEGKVSTKFSASDVLDGGVLRAPRKDRYYGGVSLWVGGFGQSMQRKEAFADAFEKVLRERLDGLSVYAMSRLD